MERRPPKALVDFAWYQDGVGLIGLVKKVKLPPLKAEVEEWLAGGMAGAIDINMGTVETDNVEVTLGEINASAIKLFGLTNGNEKPFTFRAALQGASGVDKFVAKFQGRVVGLDSGDLERKKLLDNTCEITWTEYTLEYAGEEVLYIDLIGGKHRVGGVDMRADINAALGI